MSNDSPSKSTDMLFNAFNVLTLIGVMVVGFGLISTIWHRPSVEALSHSLYPAGAPLMNSSLADFLMHRWVGVVIGLAVLGLVVKEFFMTRVAQRMMVNGLALVLFVGLAGLLVMLLQSPVAR
ncbi:hypothetical protein [Mangrovitalea sediminis]|uniref:hypothetical protein n=1 Tax=Mangrovitalea sediminis TaxID=1982043 RepID=UPI000BE5BDF6|nr:hypothetical protein [Mangrovitalea sediminis]